MYVLLPFYYPLFFLHWIQYYSKHSIHLDVCVPSVTSSARTGFLYCGNVNNISSRDDRGIGVRWPDDDRTDICKSSSDNFSFIHTARSPCDHRGRILRWPERRSTDLWHYFPMKFQTVAHRSPPDVRTASRREPVDEWIAPGIGRWSSKF